MKKPLTTKDAAKIISELTGKPMSVRQVQTEIKKDHLKAELIGGVYFIEMSAIKRYKRGHVGHPRQKIRGKK
ncbi:MAG TPA: hypothetical protein VN703_08390 [Candidatus Sulfopaludibacter sp.]|nr:hypothetical protein [Candidatus Sulfopaludibacter sp.]